MGSRSSKIAGEVSCIINGKTLSVPKGTTVYKATQQVIPMSQKVPTLCYHPYLEPANNCGICEVDIDGELLASCCTLVEEGMIINTDTPEVNEHVKSVLKRLLSSHPLECPTCNVNLACTFQDLLARYAVSPKDLSSEQKQSYVDSHSELFSEIQDYFGNFAVDIDPSKCILCQRCVRVCDEVQNIKALDFNEEKNIISAFESDLKDSPCVSCGQCTFVCPTGAISCNSHLPAVNELLRKSATKNIENLLEDDVILVASTAPAVRVTIAEDLGLNSGEITEDQLFEGLKRIGFDYVFDTDFTADLTIIEEGNELIQRVTEGGTLPMFTSCCPAWINLVETQYPEFIPNLSTCKSPQGMMGALIKNYWAEKMNYPKKQIINVSIMPCTAKKDEIQREILEGDVDYVLTVRELAYLFKTNGMSLKSYEGVRPDDPLGNAGGAAVIFGTTGGVMEAALRTAYEVIVGEELPGIDFHPARGLQGIKEATVKVGDLDLNIAIAHSLSNTKELMESMKNGEKDYHFVEIMACPSGCTGGGGNPKVKLDEDHLTTRMERIYNLDENMEYRKSHLNPSVIEIYEEFLKEPLGHHSHHLLHTTYTDRSN